MSVTVPEVVPVEDGGPRRVWFVSSGSQDGVLQSPEVQRVISDPTWARFWSKVDFSDPDGCWPWTGASGKSRYGNFGAGPSRAERRTVSTHRFAWELAYGPIPKGIHVCHHCDNPPCVNFIRCLFTGTNADNVADKMAKGRALGPRGRPEFHPRHKLNPDRVRLIRSLRAAGEPVTALAVRFDASEGCIRHALNGRTYGDVA